MSNQDFILSILPREPNHPVTPLEQMHVNKIIKKQRLDVNRGKGSDGRSKSHGGSAAPRQGNKKDEGHQVDEFV